jgi:hypothetical protein
MADDDGGGALYGGSVPPGQAPACACAAPVRRTVLDKRLEVVIEGCLRCGETIGYTQTVDWVSHPHDVRLIAVTPLRMGTALGRWIARWPRLAGLTDARAGRDGVWLAADARADDEATASRLEAEAAAVQRGLPLAERLRRAGAPADPPPAPLAPELELWTAVHRAKAFSSASPFLDVLTATAWNPSYSPSSLPAWIAADALTARPDRAERLAATLAGGGPAQRSLVMSYLAHAPLPTAEIAALVAAECRNILADLETLLQAGARTVPSDVDSNFSVFATALPRALPAEEPLAALLRQLHRRIAEVHQRRIHVPGPWRKTLKHALGVKK